MRCLIYDHGAVGGGIAMNAARAGHKVFWYVDPTPANFADLVGNSLHPNITKVNEWVPYATKVDLIIATENSGNLKSLERFRKRGVAVYAPSQECANIEINRGNGLKWFEQHGLPVPEYKTFKTLKEAEQHVIKTEEVFCFKTLGDNEDKSLTFVSKSPEQMVQQLRMWQKAGMNPKGEVMLQKKVENILCEMSVSSYLGPNGFNGPFIHCWEHKKLMNGEIGPATGEMGSVMLAQEKSKLAQLVLTPLEDSLAKMNAFCNFDVNTIIDTNGDPWILEATSRFGWPATNIELEMWESDFVEDIYNVCQGVDTIELSKDWTLGVVVAIPPWPKKDEDAKEVVGIPLYGVTEKNEEHIHPQSIMVEKVLGEGMEEQDHWVSAGNYIAVVTGKGETLTKAKKNTYAVVDELSISNMMFRTDISDKVAKVLPELEEMGFVSGLNSEED